MKKVFSFATLAMFVLAVSLTSCRNDAATQAPAATEPAATEQPAAAAPADTTQQAAPADTTKAQ